MSRHSAAQPKSPRFAPRIDPDEVPDLETGEDEKIVGGIFYIEYRDCKGGNSARDILVRRVEWRSGKIAIAAHCMLRNELRCFIASNITSLIHGRTGEVIPDPVAFFSSLAGEPPSEPRRKTKSAEAFAEPPRLSVAKMREQLRDKIRPTAILLMAMARADQTLCNEEIGIIADLVWQGSRATYTFEQTDILTEMVREMTALQPSRNHITRALNLTLDRGAFPADLPSWLSRMARADGSVVEAEHVMYRDILTNLRRLVEERERKPHT